MAARGDSDRAAPAATETPVLEALHLRASALAAPPALGRSSSQSSSSSSGSRRRFVVGRQTPFLRRSMAQDSDPCMLGSSFDGWSDDEEEEKKEHDGENHRTRAAATRPVLQRSRTEQVPAGAHHAADVRAQSDVGLPPAVVPPIAPLNIRVRKVASTSALDLKSAKLTADASSPAASVSSLPPMLENSFDRVDVELTSVVEEGGSADDDRDHGDEMLRAGRFTSEQLTDPTRHSLLTYTAAAPPPPAPAPSGRMGWLFAWTSPRFRRWYGRILNSYFAFWLVACTVVVALIQLVLLLTAMLLNNEKTRESSVDPTCHTLGLRSLHYLAAVACMLLVLPVVSPIDAFRLYHKRDADRRMVRLPYLHVCELFVTVEVMYLIFFLLHRGYKLPQTVVCHSNYTKSERMFLYGTFTLWGVLWWQLIVFSRFLVHLKLQADAANESTHTSALSDWLRVSNTRELTVSKAARPVQRFKKLLYRAAARGDTDAVNDLVDAASLESFGIDGADGVRALYASSPTLWLFAFAVSCKNPLHIAAKRGHVEIVDKLLSLGFDANALDKVARVNFNMGLLFKLATRMLSTQDGDKALLKPVLCSVLLPPLHGAVAAGHVDVVRLLLEKGAANPNALPRASFYYPSAVIPAIFVADDPEIVKLLVAKGANFLHVATTTLSGLASNTYATALQRSALTQRSATTEYLLSCGGDVALTPLHAAAAADNVRTVKRLLRRREGGRDRSSNGHVNARGERVEGVQRRTPLHWAAVVGRAAAAEALLERGADPDARDRYGRTPLHWAAHNNHADVVALLLEHGADAQAQDDGGVPVLSFAAESEGVEQRVIEALLERGASLKHALPGSGDTPLHIALVRENRATATALIRLGADLLAVNSYGKRAVDVTTSTRLLFDLKKQAATRDVMISYPHSHFAFAQRVREYLETHGKLTCWMDTMDPSGIGGGAVWREEIARGIHNCSLVVSIVCGGYTTSEWCLKELALAKMIRKPVIALLVEPPVSVVDVETDAGEISVLDAFVPRDHQLPFHSFVRGTCVMDKSVELDVDDAELDAVWRDVLPRLKNAMQTPDHTNGRWLKSHSTVSSTLGSSGIGGIGGRRFDSRTESVVEGDEAEKSGDGEDDERKTDDMDDTVSLASSLGVSTDSTRKQLSVAVYSTLPHSVLLERLVQDMGSEGFRARALTVDTHDDAQFTHQLTAFRVLVVVVESLGDDASREQRQAAGAQLATLLRAAAGVPNGLRVCPVVVREEFLSFSNLYTLARSELLYFVSGAGERQATKALLRQLRRAAATDSK